MGHLHERSIKVLQGPSNLRKTIRAADCQTSIYVDRSRRVLTLGIAAPQTIELTPTDDIWVYPHASDPEKDGYLRCWGVDGQAVAPDPAQNEEFLLQLPQASTLPSCRRTPK